MLPDVDIAGQEALLGASVLIIGIGGLGSPAALYLAAAGVGQLRLCDDDDVDLSNLQRQVAHTVASIGTNKAESAAARIAEINPGTQVEVIPQRMTEEALEDALPGVDLVLDCTDNFSTRALINNTCWHNGMAVVSGAAIGFEGQLTVFDPAVADSPCYRCLYPRDDDVALNCAENGVIAPLVGIIGTYQAMEAIKHIAGIGETLVGHIVYFDAKYSEWRRLKLGRRAECEVCGAR
jgi:adenylyltransferase/sulfurtransferase